MNLFLWIVIVCAAGGFVGGLEFDRKAQEFFVKIANTLRKIPDTANMRLAEAASRFSENCNELFEHSGVPPDVSYNPVGVTRYKMRSEVADLLVPLLSWYSRGYFYNFEQRVCNITKTCQYFTHVMRHSTERVGCGYGLCPLGVNCNKHAFVSCFFGNSQYIDGQALYDVGNFCSSCPDGFKCSNQLCERRSNDGSVIVFRLELEIHTD